MKKLIGFILSSFLLFLMSGNVGASILTFDDAISGATSYSFDSDADTIDDVIFSTTDSLGFNTSGPGPNMSYINEPGLEGTSLLSTDLKVDFLLGAIGTLEFGFAVNTGQTSFVGYGVTFSVFDSSNNSLYSNFWEADLTTTASGLSSHEEAYVTATFLGTAAYATFNFNAPSRYILDNFQGTFGSTERPPVPEPATMLLFSLGLLGLAGVNRRKN